MTIGCLLLHGFTGAPYEVEPLTSFLRENTDWKIVTPTLPGHGEQSTLKGVSYQQWIDHARGQLHQLQMECETVYLIGFSMGGMIAAHLASVIKVDRLVLLSAAALYINPKQLLLDLRAMIQDSVRRRLADNELYLRYKVKFGNTPLSATREFQKLVREAKQSLVKVNTPVLIVQGECDGIVPVKSATFLYEKLNSSEKYLCLLPNAKHHVCYGEDQLELFKQVARFLDIEAAVLS